MAGGLEQSFREASDAIEFFGVSTLRDVSPLNYCMFRVRSPAPPWLRSARQVTQLPRFTNFNKVFGTTFYALEDDATHTATGWVRDPRFWGKLDARAKVGVWIIENLTGPWHMSGQGRFYFKFEQDLMHFRLFEPD